MNDIERAALKRKALTAAASALVYDAAVCARMTPREQAEAAYRPWVGPSVDELEQRIRARRSRRSQRPLAA
ncbi:hypothetical protein ACFY2W_23405 [Streptomyces sp. NPDC001262]|uniref:hypothetical protein n=1 Tax=Streptomyces sp. NPDC001262 TaxID=3364552 RepID=UPI0036AE0925